ncbi:DnaJ domain-containing protein [bacterium]|nr:DnaJ domain-containing protein [bacterium]
MAEFDRLIRDVANSYRLLGLAPGASWPDVRRNYRRLVREWHPDQFGHSVTLQTTANEKLKEINVAYEQIRKFRDVAAHVKGAPNGSRSTPNSSCHTKSGRESTKSSGRASPNDSGNQKEATQRQYSIFELLLRHPAAIRFGVLVVSIVVSLLRGGSGDTARSANRYGESPWFDQGRSLRAGSFVYSPVQPRQEYDVTLANGTRVSISNLLKLDLSFVSKKRGRNNPVSPAELNNADVSVLLKSKNGRK